MKSSITLTALALTGSVLAEDALYSKRLTKRFVDDDGHYNMCKFWRKSFTVFRDHKLT
jgi:5'-nucleotidase